MKGFIDTYLAMKYFVLMYLLGPAMILAGIAGIVLVWVFCKNFALGVLVDIVCIGMVVFGVIIIDTTIELIAEHRHWGDYNP